MLVHRKVTPSIFAGHLYAWVERGTVRVKCLGQEHNTMSPARTRTRTTRSGVEHSNHEATAPPLFQDYPIVIRFNLVHLCPSMLLFPFSVFLFCCSTVLSGYCNVSFYIFGKKRNGKQLIKCLFVLALEH